MESTLDFARGPLFRMTFAIMLLGLLRIFILDLWGLYEAYKKAGDKNIPWKLAFQRTISWFLPLKKIPASRPFYSLSSMLFHVGLILVPIFLFAHVSLWNRSLGFGWVSLPQQAADILTIATIIFGIMIFVGRVASKSASFISRKQDYLWPPVLLIPFTTGFICANIAITPASYQFSMLVHILSGEMIFILMPFTKIAHCVIMPFSQLVSTIAWRFPPATDEDVSVTLGKKGAPV